jgi:hypothetical protein
MPRFRGIGDAENIQGEPPERRRAGRPRNGIRDHVRPIAFIRVAYFNSNARFVAENDPATMR